MRFSDGRVLLSSSDLSDYLACRHLTTLSAETARGERERPRVREALAELVAAKGELAKPSPMRRE